MRPDRSRGVERWLCQPLRCTPDKYGETAGGQLGLTAMRRSNPRRFGLGDRVLTGQCDRELPARNRHDEPVVVMRRRRFARVADREQHRRPTRRTYRHLRRRSIRRRQTTGARNRDDRRKSPALWRPRAASQPTCMSASRCSSPALHSCSHSLSGSPNWVDSPRRFLASHRVAVSVRWPREVTGVAGGLLVPEPPQPASNPTTTINNVRVTVEA
jgi:hypothetical protein